MGSTPLRAPRYRVRAAGALDRLTARLLPSPCAGCGAAGDPLCAACAAGLVAARPGPLPAGVDRLVVPYSYEGAARELVARVKYRNARHAATFLAAAMAGASDPALPAGATVTWAPTTPGRRRERGFDHGELLARAVARELGRPVRRMLDRPPGPPQTGRSRAERRRVPPAFRPTAGVTAATVVLVDDVVTTGSTLGGAARALRRAGSTTVVGMIAARTPRPW